MVAKPLYPLYKNIIKPLDRVRYPELRYHFTKRTAVPGRWWLYMIYYDGLSQENEIDVYLPMQ